MKEKIINNAKMINQLRQELNVTFRHRKRSKNDKLKWKKAAAAFHRKYNQLMYPADFKKSMADIIEGKSEAILMAIDYLEADPDFYRSDNLKEKILDTLGKAILTEDDIDRLQNIILRIIDTKDCKEFRYYCRFARRLISIGFSLELEKRSVSSNEDVRGRAKLMMKYLRGKTKSTRI